MKSNPVLQRVGEIKKMIRGVGKEKTKGEKI